MTLNKAVGWGLISVLLGAGLISIVTVPAFAGAPGDINFWLSNTGSSTGGGLTTNNGATGSAEFQTMGSTTFTFANSGYTYTKIAAGSDNFILMINGATSGMVCLDITLTATSHGTDSGTACSTVAGSGLYTFSIPSTWGGLVTSAQTNTATIKCDATTTAPGGCAAISLGWAGNTSSSSNIQIPSTVPEFGVATILVGAVGLLGVALVRKSKVTATPSGLAV